MMNEEVRSKAIEILDENVKFKSARDKFYVYNNLSEAKITEFVNKIGLRLFHKLAWFESKKDYSDIDATKGDFKRLKDFNVLSLKNKFETIQKTPSFIKLPLEQKEVIYTLMDSIRVFVRYSDEFKHSFLKKIPLVQMIYRETFVSIICLSGYVVSNCLEYTDEGTISNIKIDVKAKNFPTNYLEYLRSFIKNDNDGSLPNALKEVVVSASNTIKNELGKFSEASYTIPIKTPGPVLAGIAIVAGMFMIVKMLRFSVFQFFYQKEKLAKYLRANATFLEINADQLERDNKDPKVIEKQRKAAQILRSIANSIAVDQQEANSKASKENKKEEIEESTGKMDKEEKDDNEDILIF